MKDLALQAVSFDAAGTLIHLAEPVGTTYARVAREHGVETGPAELGQAFKTVWKRTPPPFSVNAPADDSPERAWWSRLVRSVFDEVDASFRDEETYDRFFEDLYRRFEEPGTWIAEPGAVEVVTRLARSFRCVVLSNFDGRLRRILADLGLLDPFEALFLSCEVRLSKPDPRFFQRVSESLAIAPGAILHVGDDPVCDWDGAEAAGFRLFRIGPGHGKLTDLMRELSLA